MVDPILTLDALDEVRLTQGRWKSRAAYSVLGALLVAVVSAGLSVGGLMPRWILGNVALLAGVVAFGGLITTIACAVRERRAGVRLAEAVDTSDLESFSMVPLPAGVTLGRLLVIASDEGTFHASATTPTWVLIVRRIVCLLCSIVLFGAFVYGLVKHGPGLAPTASFQALKLFWMLPLIGLGTLGAALITAPVQWYASRDEGVLRMERLRWIAARDVIDVSVSEFAGFELVARHLSLKSNDAKRHNLASFGEIENAPGGTILDRRARSTRLTNWKASRVAASIMSVLTDAPGHSMSVTFVGPIH